MKNYIVLLLGLTFVGVYAVEMPTKIRYYNSFNDAKQQKPNSITLGIEQNSTKNHVRDQLLRELGAGHFMEGNVESFSADESSNIPLITIYKNRLNARAALEKEFSYWRFDFSPAQLNEL